MFSDSLYQSKSLQNHTSKFNYADAKYCVISYAQCLATAALIAAPLVLLQNSASAAHFPAARKRKRHLQRMLLRTSQHSRTAYWLVGQGMWWSVLLPLVIVLASSLILTFLLPAYLDPRASLALCVLCPWEHHTISLGIVHFYISYNL